MRINVTQKMIDDFLADGSYWIYRVNRSFWTSASWYDPICAAVREATGREVKVNFWSQVQIGVLTKCHGGYYMYAAPKELLDAGHFEQGAFILDRPIAFDLPVEGDFQREVETEKWIESQFFAYAI
jgi:hypothetical protein